MYILLIWVKVDYPMSTLRGYTNNCDTGFTNNYDTGYTNNYYTGYTNNCDTGYTNNYDTGYTNNYDTGYTNNYDTSYTNNYDTGYTNNYDTSQWTPTEFVSERVDRSSVFDSNIATCNLLDVSHSFLEKSVSMERENIQNQYIMSTGRTQYIPACNTEQSQQINYFWWKHIGCN